MFPPHLYLEEKRWFLGWCGKEGRKTLGYAVLLWVTVTGEWQCHWFCRAMVMWPPESMLLFQLLLQALH